MITHHQLIFMNDELVKFLHEKDLLTEFVDSAPNGAQAIMFCVSDAMSNLTEEELNEHARLALIESMLTITNNHDPEQEEEEEDNV